MRSSFFFTASPNHRYKVNSSKTNKGAGLVLGIFRISNAVNVNWMNRQDVFEKYDEAMLRAILAISIRGEGTLPGFHTIIEDGKYMHELDFAIETFMRSPNKFVRAHRMNIFYRLAKAISDVNSDSELTPLGVKILDEFWYLEFKSLSCFGRGQAFDSFMNRFLETHGLKKAVDAANATRA